MRDPFAQFTEWFTDAQQCDAIADATAMTLATATADGKPSARVVLLKDFNADGFVFYGNMESRKFSELATNPQAALCFYWIALNRQVRIEGTVTRVGDAEADAYFATRGRGKQVGAWASQQSRPMANREEFEAHIAMFDKQFAGVDVPRPPHWSGWRLAPTAMEFWSNGEFRLHDRELFTRANTQSPWVHSLLYP